MKSSECGEKERIRYPVGEARTLTYSITEDTNPEGFYSEDWDKDQQDKYNWQAPDKCQKISQMMFCNEVLEIHPLGDKVISSLLVQHQGGGCSTSEDQVQDTR